MNIYDYIKNIYEKGFTFAKSVETKMMDDFNKLLGMFSNPIYPKI